MEKRFDIIEHTADIGITAYGRDLAESFANAACGLFALINSPDDVRHVIKRDIRVTASDREALLVAWLNELIYVFDVEHVLFSRFEVTVLSNTELVATCYGEVADPGRHQLRMAVKAATYHALELTESAGRYKANVIFDI